MGVTLFDFIAVAIVGVSGLVGFSRGAVRELVTVVAFTVAAMAAIYLLPFAAALLGVLMTRAGAATAAAVVVVFIVAYIALRLGGQWVASRLQSKAALGTVDRVIGLAFGVVRALVFLGVFYLVFSVATPPELTPPWIANAKLLPVARVSAEALQSLAPRTLMERGPLAPALERVTRDDPPAAQRSRRNPTRTVPGYDKRSRDDIDALVEKTR
jgi:membrane protein required for colicin V production